VLEELEGFPEWCEVSKGTLKFPIGKKLPKKAGKKADFGTAQADY
jgi:hypothetical protein